MSEKMDERVRYYLDLPYHWVFLPEGPSSDGFSAMIMEFPGCFAQGDTLEEARENLKNAAGSWLLACLDRGLKIRPPVPMQVSQMYANRYVLETFMDDDAIKKGGIIHVDPGDGSCPEFNDGSTVSNEN